MVALGRVRFLMSEVPLYQSVSDVVPYGVLDTPSLGPLTLWHVTWSSATSTTNSFVTCSSHDHKV